MSNLGNLKKFHRQVFIGSYLLKYSTLVFKDFAGEFVIKKTQAHFKGHTAAFLCASFFGVTTKT